MSSSAPTVAVWRTNWLPASETFILNQVRAMRRWHPLMVGVRRLPDGMDVVPDRAPFSSGLVGKISHRISERLGYRGAYDRWLKDQGVQVIHAHFGPGGIKVLPVARRTGIPLVVTFHGFDVTIAPARPGQAGVAYRRQLTQLFAEATVLIAVSEYVASLLVGLGAPASKIVVHYLGIPAGSLSDAGVESGASSPADATNTASDELVVTFVGRLIERKGVDHLLRAVALLPQELRSRVRVKIVGFGDQESKLRKLAADCGCPVDFLGKRTPAEVQHILAGSTVFAGPSRLLGNNGEGFGLVYLEAGLAGLPVVAYRQTGAIEAVADGVTGLLAEDSNVDQLAANLGRLLADPDLAKTMGANGRQRVLSQFDIVEQTKKLEEIYDRAARETS